MNNPKIDIRLIVVSVIILLVALSRLFPIMPNFSPIGAMALFGAAFFSKRWQALILPLVAVWASDLLINNVLYKQYFPEFTLFYSGFCWQYGSFLIITLLGLTLFKKINATRVAGGIIGSSLIFFLISNFGVWLGSTVYPQNFQGLIACYVAGIPFLKGTLLSDAFYTTVLFSAYFIAQSRIPALKTAK